MYTYMYIDIYKKVIWRIRRSQSNSQLTGIAGA